MATEILRMGVLSAGGLGNVRLDRHAARDDIGSHTATGCVLRSGGSTKPLGELLNKSLSNIVHSNVHGVSNTEDDQ